MQDIHSDLENGRFISAHSRLSAGIGASLKGTENRPSLSQRKLRLLLYCIVEGSSRKMIPRPLTAIFHPVVSSILGMALSTMIAREKVPWRRKHHIVIKPGHRDCQERMSGVQDTWPLPAAFDPQYSVRSYRPVSPQRCKVLIVFIEECLCVLRVSAVK